VTGPQGSKSSEVIVFLNMRTPETTDRVSTSKLIFW